MHSWPPFRQTSCRPPGIHLPAPTPAATRRGLPPSADICQSSAGAAWLARNGHHPEKDSIVPTLGVHAAVMAVISALTVPGDYIVYEHVTYAQVARSAGLIGRRAVMVDLDDEGTAALNLDELMGLL